MTHILTACTAYYVRKRTYYMLKSLHLLSLRVSLNCHISRSTVVVLQYSCNTVFALYLSTLASCECHQQFEESILPTAHALGVSLKGGSELFSNDSAQVTSVT
jgi:hypothetical protein